ncbi:exodeoxyribonuclease VII large subunit [uncultured Anaerotruncus sp.]|uniref:exodeoxyribonuclease VII large subunit n=1 Tax=uncultured Anaerotruncus sp. TaxID=905011 RepID=UPI002582CDE3|nr:exodeoxyribonuclease VII large subunit [uncultured Anaerotruncus sp.]
MLKNPTVVSVSQLNRYVKSLLESDHVLSGLMVRGEISNFTRHYKSGHLYFTLKDDSAAVKAVMFRSYAARVPFSPENGMSVIVSGSVSLYERDGSYQFYVTDMQPDGIGALHLAYEQLKAKLAAEGLFDEARKRPLPPYPERIGIVTSEGAAALQDMLNILSRRYPAATVVLCPAQVQGAGAARTLIDGIRALNAAKACDLIIIGRGGGSIEDLWAFNDETLARAIAASGIPVISAVGHETDFTIADFAADLRAPTPSAAAELAVPNMADLQYYLADLGARCHGAVVRRIEGTELRLRQLRAGLTTPEGILRACGLRLDALEREIRAGVLQKLDGARNRLQYLGALVEERSPMKILSRGYSLTSADGRTVLSAEQVKPGDLLTTRVADGEILSKVTGTNRRTT